MVNLGEKNGSKGKTLIMRYNTQDWKGSFINDIIKDSNYSSYLELGVAVGESWKRIFCKNNI